MKKILFVLCFSLLSLIGISQPITARGTSSVTVSDARLQAQYNLFIPRYADTTAANLQKGIDSCGALIYTYNGNKIWKRGCSPKHWIEVGGATSVPNLQQVTDQGNSTTNFVDLTSLGYLNRIESDRINIYGYDESVQLSMNINSGSPYFSIFDPVQNTYFYNNKIVQGTEISHFPINNGSNDTLATLANVRASGGGGSGTVTSVATGYGLSGGTITTSGTLIVDSATLSNKYLRIVDTANKWVNSVTKLNDTTINVVKGTSNTSFTLPNYWTKSGNYTYLKASTDSVGIGTSSPAYKLDVNGVINGTAINLQNGVKTGIYGSTNILDFWAGGNKLSTYTLVGNAAGSYFTHDLPFINSASSSGTQNAWRLSSSITPSGANSMIHNQLLIDPTYTQSTLGTGTIRGIYYNPTITSLNTSAHYAWESTSGGIKFGGMTSTSDTSTYKPVGIDNVGNLTKMNSWGGFDSTSLSNRINLKLNISDTASMLSKYVRKDTSCFYLISDATTTNLTATNTNLTFSIAANETYRIMIAGTAKNSTTGQVKIAIGAPTGCTMRGIVSGGGATMGSSMINQALNAVNTLSGSFSSGSNVETAFRFEGSITNGANAGSITLQFSAGTTGTATIFSGTVMQLTRTKGL